VQQADTCGQYELFNQCNSTYLHAATRPAATRLSLLGEAYKAILSCLLTAVSREQRHSC
jgi:hypothetical protein